MKNYETKDVIHKEKVLTGIVCDTCRNKIEADIYFDVTTQHGNWGNDSCDSIEHHDFCSYACMRKHMDFYFSDPESTLQYDIEIEFTP